MLSRPRLVATVVLAAVTALSACAGQTRESLRLNGKQLIVENQTDEDWTNVRVLLNRYYAAGAPVLKAHGRLDVRLDSFISGYLTRFDSSRESVKDLRLTATRPNGQQVELKNDFTMPKRESGGNR